MHFMVEGTLKQAHTEETLALIPAEVARGKALDAEGVRTALYVAADLSKAWQVYQLESQAELEQTLATFPLHPFISYTITPLAPAM